MKTNFEYKIDHELKINFDIIKGEVDLNMLIEHEKIRIKSDKFNQNYNSLIDIRGAKFVNFLDDIDEFCDFLDAYTQQLKLNMERKIALITSNPLEVVNSTIFALGFGKKDSNLEIESFSTEKAAIQWLSS